MPPSNPSTERTEDGERGSAAVPDHESGSAAVPDHESGSAAVSDHESGSAAVPDHESGSAALEFILVGLILLVPLVYLVIALGLIQGQSLGAEAGARHIARAVSLAGDADAALASAERVLGAVVADYGLDADAVDVGMECRPSGTTCPEAGAVLVVTVRTQVALPLVPPILGLDRLASIPVEASAAQKVSRFWGVP